MLNSRLNERIREIEQRAAAEITPAEIQGLLEDSRAEYQHLMSSRRHDEAIGLMERLRRLAADDP